MDYVGQRRVDMRHISFDGAVKIYFVSLSQSTRADNEVESSPLILERRLEMVGKPNKSCKHQWSLLSKQTGVFLRCSLPGFNGRLPAVFLRRVT